LLPLVGKRLDSIQTRIRLLKGAGYKVHLVLVDLPIEKAVNRAIRRYRDDGRFVDPEYITQIGDAPARTYDALKEEADSYAKFSTDVAWGSEPILTEQGSR